MPIIIALLVPAFLLAMLMSKVLPGQMQQFLKAKKTHQLAIVLVLAFAAYSAQKPSPEGPSRFHQALMYIRDYNMFPDLSGRFHPWIKSMSNREANLSARSIYVAAQDAIAPGTNAIAQMGIAMSTNDIERAYISFSAHRENDNMIVKVIEWQDVVIDEVPYVDALIHFSTHTATNVNVNMEYVTDSILESLVFVTNYYPVSEIVNTYECYRYRYERPNTTRQLLPISDVSLGGFTGQYFDAVDIVVDDGLDYWYSYSGWDDYSTDEVELKVRYSHGIAVEALYNGAVIRGGNMNRMSLEIEAPLDDENDYEDEI